MNPFETSIETYTSYETLTDPTVLHTRVKRTQYSTLIISSRAIVSLDHLETNNFIQGILYSASSKCVANTLRFYCTSFISLETLSDSTVLSMFPHGKYFRWITWKHTGVIEAYCTILEIWNTHVSFQRRTSTSATQIYCSLYGESINLTGAPFTLRLCFNIVYTHR